MICDGIVDEVRLAIEEYVNIYSHFVLRCVGTQSGGGLNLVGKMLAPTSVQRVVLVLFLCLGGCGTVPRRQVRDVPMPLAEDMPARREFVSPLPGARVISNFGKRRHEFHQGIDLVKSRAGGDPVYAARAGVVEAAQRCIGYGRMVLIYHKDGCRTRYAHLAKMQVQAGQAVAAGEEIGTVGSTGRATTPHLHFEIITRSHCPIDPRPYLP